MEKLVLILIILVTCNFMFSTQESIYQECNGKADVVVILDSVDKINYVFMKAFVLHVARTFSISENGVRLGVVSYALTGINRIGLNVFGIEANKAAVEDLRSDLGAAFTNIRIALKRADEILHDTSNGARADALKLIVVTTDGTANRADRPAFFPTAQEIKARNVTIISIGIANELTKNMTEIKSLASSPALYHFLPTFYGLSDASYLTSISKTLCRALFIKFPTVGKTQTAIYESTPAKTNIHIIPIVYGEVIKPIFTSLPQTNLPFTVNSQTGHIITTGLLDRERTPKYIFGVKVTNTQIPQFTTTITVTITILDENDNNPIPDKVMYNIDVFENIPFVPPALIETISAKDTDEGRNAVLTYHVLSGNEDNKFNLGISNGALTVIGQLDREVKDSYEIIAEARDQGIPNRNSVPITISIIVKDINDNNPVFPNAVVNLVYTIYKELGNVHQLIATDLDRGLNKQIEYTITSGNGDGIFSLGKDNGFIQLLTQFNYRRDQWRYQLVVNAEDKGTPNRSSNVTLNIKFTYEDERQTIYGPRTKTVPENHGTVAPVLEVYSMGLEGPTRVYSIEEVCPFSIDSDGVMKVNGTIDRDENIFSYVLTLRVRSGTTTGTRSVTIYITDVNDNTPTFSRTAYTGIIDENSSDGTKVVPTSVAVTATDGDATSPNKDFMFSIDSGNRNDAFKIHEVTGQVSANKQSEIDFEKIEQYTLIIKVTDKGVIPNNLFSTSTYTINIKNLNDNDPKFSVAVVNLLYPESQPLENLHQLVATDADKGKSGEIMYTILYGNDDEKFALEKKTGFLSLVSALDYEEKNSYQLVVNAKDKGTPNRSSVVTVNIEVTNVDETLTIHGPRIKAIPENQGNVAPVLNVTATDPEGSAITYSIEEESPFSIDSDGVIKVGGTIDREGKIFFYVLTVKANAGSHSVTTFVIITITDVNDNTPTFSETTYIGIIDENSPDGTNVVASPVAVSATDGDATSPNKDFMISIDSGNMNDAFKIHAVTGQVSVNNQSEIDFEKIEQYTLIIKVTDKGLIPNNLFSTSTYTINVINLNDNDPKFSKSGYEISIPENTVINTGILTVTAFDGDKDLPGMLIHFIASGNVDGKYIIDQVTGEIKVKADLNTRASNKYILIITAADKGTPSRSGTTRVIINISDVNHPPVFIVAPPANVSENAADDLVVTKAKATDPDTGLNGEIMYKISGGNDEGLFKINMSTGEILVAKGLKSASRRTYLLKINVTDKGTPPLSTAGSLLIITFKEMPTDICRCDLKYGMHPCLTWTKIDIIRNFKGKCYLDKLEAAVSKLSTNIKDITSTIAQFKLCKKQLHKHISSPAKTLPVSDLFGRYESCTVNIHCKIIQFKYLMERKKIKLQHEIVLEKEGWNLYNVPGLASRLMLSVGSRFM